MPTPRRPAGRRGRLSPCPHASAPASAPPLASSCCLSLLSIPLVFSWDLPPGPEELGNRDLGLRGGGSWHRGAPWPPLPAPALSSGSPVPQAQPGPQPGRSPQTRPPSRGPTKPTGAPTTQSRGLPHRKDPPSALTGTDPHARRGLRPARDGGPAAGRRAREREFNYWEVRRPLPRDGWAGAGRRAEWRGN